MLVVVVVAALLLVSALPGLHSSPALLPEDFQYDMEAAKPNQYEGGYLQGEAVMEEPTLVPASDDDDVSLLVLCSAPSVPQTVFTITEKAPTRAFS